MEMRSAATSTNKKPSVGRVKPILRGNPITTTSTPPSDVTTNSSLRRPPPRSDGARALVRRSHNAECEARFIERTAHVEALRERVRRFLQQAAHFRSDRRGSSNVLPGMQSTDEVTDEPIPNVFSHMLENPQPEVSLQNALHEVLSDVEKALKEDVNQQMKKSYEYNEHKMEELTRRFEQFLCQQEYAHRQELLELHGCIEYLQEELATTREQKEVLEQELEDANLKMLEKAEDMGSIRAEVTDLRREVQELRTFKTKHRREMQNVEKLRRELETFQEISRITREEFAKVECERDELREEFEKSLQKIKLANQRRNCNIEDELDEAVDELLS